MEVRKRMEEREEASRRCKALLERIQLLPPSKVAPCCISTLLRLVNSDLHFLSSPSSSSSLISSNVGYFEAIVHILEQPWITGVSRVCKPLPSPSIPQPLHIDIVCCIQSRPAWFIVSDRNPNYITWDSYGKHNKRLKFKIEQIVGTAHLSMPLKPAYIVLFFANGLDVSVMEILIKNFGFREFDLRFSQDGFVFDDVLDADWVHVVGRSYQRACCLIMDIDQSEKRVDVVVDVLSSSGVHEEIVEICEEYECEFRRLLRKMKEWSVDVKDKVIREVFLGDELVNFDTTALVAIVSGISNGGAEKILAKSEDELKKRFKNNTEFVISQALSEIESPLYDDLSSALSGKKGILCETVHSEFVELVSMFGGPEELTRANQLVKFLKVVPDSPSPRMMSLPVTRKLALKNKVAFGTGDYWGAPTLSANMGFVRAVCQTGMSLFTLGHRPRALVGD